MFARHRQTRWLGIDNYCIRPSYHYRRRLPHHQWLGKKYFITFRTFRHFHLTAGSRDIVLDVCLAGRGQMFRLHAIVVMPDHVHLVLSPLDDEEGVVPLQKILHAIKGASAHRINKYLGRKGRIWQDESFDRAMRSSDNYWGKLEYIVANPVRAGLVENPSDYKWLWTEPAGETPAPHDLNECRKSEST